MPIKQRTYDLERLQACLQLQDRALKYTQENMTEGIVRVIQSGGKISHTSDHYHL